MATPLHVSLFLIGRHISIVPAPHVHLCFGLPKQVPPYGFFVLMYTLYSLRTAFHGKKSGCVVLALFFIPHDFLPSVDSGLHEHFLVLFTLSFCSDLSFLSQPLLSSSVLASACFGQFLPPRITLLFLFLFPFSHLRRISVPFPFIPRSPASLSASDQLPHSIATAQLSFLGPSPFVCEVPV
jgi:hypothetical protein